VTSLAVIDFTRNVIVDESALPLCTTVAISITTVDPAGKTAPFVPVTAADVCAIILSPGRFASEHARESSVSPTEVPAAITPRLAGAGADAGVGVGAGFSMTGG
jgi:hypothetical protein